MCWCAKGTKAAWPRVVHISGSCGRRPEKEPGDVADENLPSATAEMRHSEVRCRISLTYALYLTQLARSAAYETFKVSCRFSCRLKAGVDPTADSGELYGSGSCNMSSCWFTRSHVRRTSFEQCQNHINTVSPLRGDVGIGVFCPKRGARRQYNEHICGCESARYHERHESSEFVG